MDTRAARVDTLDTSDRTGGRAGGEWAPSGGRTVCIRPARARGPDSTPVTVAEGASASGGATLQELKLDDLIGLFCRARLVAAECECRAEAASAEARQGKAGGAPSQLGNNKLPLALAHCRLRALVAFN